MITRNPWVKVVLNNIWNPADQKAELFFQRQQDKENEHDNNIDNDQCTGSLQYAHCAQGFQFSDLVARLLLNHGIDNSYVPTRERH